LKHSDPTRFSHAFFYNAANHSLVIPGAHFLLRDYTGGATLSAKEIKMAPTFDSLPTTYQGSPGELAPVVEKIEQVAPLHGFIRRESKLDYLKRFYAFLRWISASQSQTPGILVEEIVAQVQSCDESIVRVEISVDIDDKMLTVFVLPDSGAGSPLRAALSHKVGALLKRIIPLDYRWKIDSFRYVPVTMYLILAMTSSVRPS
jgi:hypothetical protein